MSNNGPEYPDTVVNLTSGNIDGNAFSIIGAVTRALRKDVGLEAAAEFQNRAFNCGSYDELLRLVMDTVTVE